MPTEQHLFSTGTLTVAPLWQPLTATKRNGDASVTPDPLLIDRGTNGQTYFMAGTSWATSEWLIIDLGQAWPVSSVLLTGAGSSNGYINIWAANNGEAMPGDAGTSPFTAAGIAAGTTPADTTIPNTLGASGRFLLIANSISTGTGYTAFLLATLRTPSIPFAVVQEMTIDITWTAKELYTDAQDSVFPIDVAFNEAKMTIKASSCGIRADALQILLKSQLSGGSVLSNTLPTAITLPPCSVTFTGQDTNSKSVIYTINNAYSKGVSLPFKLNDFVIAGFELEAVRDENGGIGSIEVEE